MLTRSAKLLIQFSGTDESDSMKVSAEPDKFFEAVLLRYVPSNLPGVPLVLVARKLIQYIDICAITPHNTMHDGIEFCKFDI